MGGILTGLQVLDLSLGPAGGLATTVLADYGARVLKVEPPGGDPERALPGSPLWLRGKECRTIDLYTAAAEVQELARTADVLVTSRTHAEAAVLGIDAAALRSLNPALVYCAITGWGATGPYATYPNREKLVMAKAGRMNAFQGLTRRPGPAYAAVRIATHAAAQAAVQGILAALLARQRTGTGQVVETSLLQGLIPYDSAGLFQGQFAVPGAPGQDFANDPNRLPTLNYHPLMTKDGRWIQFGNLLEHLFYSSIESMDLLETVLATGQTGQPASWPDEVREAIRDAMLRRMREKTADEWMELFRRNGNVAAEVYATTQEALHNPEVTLPGNVVESDGHRWLGPIARFEVHADRGTQSAGESGGKAVHAPHSAPPAQHDAQMAKDSLPALTGVTVVEFATIIAAPLACTLLAELGARVIKVEPIGGDPGRPLGMGPVGGYGSLRWNSGKESLCVDLKTAEGRAVVERLLPKADIIIHNYRPGVPERLGLGYEQAAKANPQVVYVVANGYDPLAPGGLRPCTHPIPGAAMGGAAWQAGAGMPPSDCTDLDDIKEAARRLMRANEVNPDPNTSMVIASAALLGLYEARTQGTGRRVFVNMMGANIWANWDDAVSYAGKADRPAIDADVLGIHALERLYPAREGWVFLQTADGDEQEWNRLCRVLDRAALASDPRFATAAARRAHDGALAAELAAAFQARTADEWERLLIAENVGCVRADATLPGAFWQFDPHAQANGFRVTAEHPVLGTYLRHGPTVALSDAPARLGPGSLPGYHTDHLLAELGYDESTIEDMKARRVVELFTPAGT